MYKEPTNLVHPIRFTCTLQCHVGLFFDQLRLFITHLICIHPVCVCTVAFYKNNNNKHAPCLMSDLITCPLCRRMFPLLQLSLLNLDPTSTYVLLLALRPVDNRRWKFLNGEWQANESGLGSGAGRGRGSDGGEDVVYVHPFSPNSGEQWMRESPVGFSRLKLSNRGSVSGRVRMR